MNSPIHLSLDKKSHLVTISTSVKLGDLRKRLHHFGYDIGFFAGKSGEECTLKNILEEGIPNLWHLRYGEIHEICTALVVGTPIGHIRTKKVPRAATGPDLKKIFIGSHHRYGDIQEITLQIIPKPETRKVVKVKASQNLLSQIWRLGIRPLTILKQSDSLLVELEGIEKIVQAEEKLLKSLAQKTKGVR